MSSSEYGYLFDTDTCIWTDTSSVSLWKNKAVEVQKTTLFSGKFLEAFQLNTKRTSMKNINQDKKRLLKWSWMVLTEFYTEYNRLEALYQSIYTYIHSHANTHVGGHADVIISDLNVNVLAYNNKKRTSLLIWSSSFVNITQRHV